jgi:hypothetical protein
MMKTLLRIFLLFFALGSADAWAYKLAVGSYTGNATDDRGIDLSDTSDSADFQPIAVIAKCNTADNPAVFRSAAAHSDANSWYMTGGITATGIKAITSTGFTLGTNAAVNGSTLSCWYVAFGDDGSGDIAVGTYTGNGLDNRDIDISNTSTYEDFLPEFVFINRSAAGSGIWLVTTGEGTQQGCGIVETLTCSSDRIQDLQATGFQIGLATSVNADAGAYAYLAIKSASGSTDEGSYSGNGTSQNITAPGFQPEFVLVKSDDGTPTCATYAKFKAQTGDDSASLSNQANTTGVMTAFLSTGFSVGSSDCANENGITYYWYAIKTLAAAPGGVARRQVIIVE